MSQILLTEIAARRFRREREMGFNVVRDLLVNSNASYA